jgi:hypothetical protein
MTVDLAVRKLVRYVEETRIEGGRAAEKPLQMIGIAAVVANPWAGRGYVEDLRPEILALAPPLGDLLVENLLTIAGSGDAVEAYGKAAVVGMSGEVEHASALIHTLRFGNRFREAVDGSTYLSFTNKRGGPGTSVQIPMMDKQDAGRRSHYLTLEFSIADAPGPDEILVAIGASTAGRPHARTGDRYQDMKELEAEGTS